LALNIGNVDPLFIREQPHINKQAAEHDGQRLNRSGHAGPAAVFSFSQQALDSAKDVGRSQLANKNQATPTAVLSPAAVEQVATPVETAAAVIATAETGKAHAAKADAPRRKDHAAEDAGSTEETWGTDEAVSTRESASAARANQRVSYQDLLDSVPR
jgi:hypothetical protein